MDRQKTITNPLHRNTLYDLAGRVALVTGASSGIGARFARVLAANGARVVLAARREALLIELRDEIIAAGGSALAVALDATDEASTSAAFDRAEQEFGTVEIVVANAGIGQKTPTLRMEMAEFDAIFDVNLRGAFLTAREGMRRLRGTPAESEGRGRIVFTSSITDTAIVPGIAAYAASKAAVSHLARGLAREWGSRGVSINVLCPGFIPTDITAESFATEAGAKVVADWPRKRMMPVDSLDGALLLLTSDAARYMSGTVVDVDDGQML